MGISSPAATTPPGAIFGQNNSTLSLVSTKSREGGGAAAVIKEGYIRCKEDKFLAGWNQRFLVLREFRLDFLKNETGKVVLSIQLSTVTGVSRSEDTKMAFEITRMANPKDASMRGGSMSRDLPTKTIICEVKNDDEIYDWIDKIYERCPGMGGVSNPTNFSHRVHVGFDPTSGAFVGLPSEWEKLLTASAITKEEAQKNPQAVIEVLEFYSNQKVGNNDAAMYKPATTQNAIAPTAQSMQGPVGSSIAPPRPMPPGGLQRLDSYQSNKNGVINPPPRSGNTTPVQTPRKVTDPDRSAYDQQQRMREAKDAEQRKLMEEEARRVQEVQRRKREQEEEQSRRDQEAYNASIPKSRVPLAQQEIGGGGYSAADKDAPSPDRYNPARAAPQAPGTQRERQPPQGSLRQITAQRQAPTAPNGASNGTPQSPNQRSQPTVNGQNALRSPSTPEQVRQPSPSSRHPAGGEVRDQSPHTRQPAATNGQAQPPSRLPAPVQQVKPLNVAKPAQSPATNKTAAVADPVRQAEQALTQKKPEERQKEVRMSSMTENEVMAKLKQVVSKDNPLDSYSKQKKIGQGASGSVYVARVKESATSGVAREIYRTHGPRGQVAIKQMDLRNQPRKELIVNEIIVMKDSKHPNIVNFLDSFLQEQNNELWVVMEFMEGGALTDVIDNNPVISEDQISTICFEVSA